MAEEAGLDYECEVPPEQHQFILLPGSGALANQQVKPPSPSYTLTVRTTNATGRQTRPRSLSFKIVK